MPFRVSRPSVSHALPRHPTANFTVDTRTACQLDEPSPNTYNAYCRISHNEPMEGPTPVDVDDLSVVRRSTDMV